MDKKMLYFIEAIANEKSLSKQDVCEAIEFSLAGAVRKAQASEIAVRVDLDPGTGNYNAFRTWLVVDPDNMKFIEVDGESIQEDFNPNTMVSLEEARKENENINLDGFLEEPIETVNFSRISAQTAKQVIFQKLREFTRRKVAEKFENRIGEIIHTTVKRNDHGRIILDLEDNVEGILMHDQQIPTENYNAGKRFRAYLYEVGLDNRAPQIYLSRAMPAMVEELLRMEVPEIADSVIEIRSVAREPGERAKVAVFTGDPHLDPVGSCVGIRGARVQAVSNELSGERIDIVIWDASPAQFVMNALAPATISSLSVDEDKRTMSVSVAEDSLAKAIGRGGQNVRLASELTGWNLNVISEKQMAEQTEIEDANIIKIFVDNLKISTKQASVLIAANISNIEEIAFMPEEELLALKDFDDATMVEAIKSKANDAMLMDLLEDGSDENENGKN